MRTESELKEMLFKNAVLLDQPNVGQGGSAVIHRGTLLRKTSDGRRQLPIKVAIKEYKDEILQKPEERTRIKSEADWGLSHAHPNVIKTLKYIDSDVDSPLLLMEWIEGLKLGEWSSKNSSAKSDWDAIRKVVLQLLNGLDYLHSNGVFHRDLKPDNIMVKANSGDAIIMDMGVSEISGNDQTTMGTKISDFVGTARYASPQFLLGEAYMASDDVYSLAATLVLLVTGTELLSEVKRKPLIPHYVLTTEKKIALLRNGVPPQIAIALEGALHSNRARRPTIIELKEVFERPDDASYLKREMEARDSEQHGFVVLSVIDDESAVLADLRGIMPVSNAFAIVRELKDIKVPSLGANARPEKWIADAELRHVHNNIGHFRVLGRRWVPVSGLGRMSHDALIAQKGGVWRDLDESQDVPQRGDLVVNR